MQPVNDRVDQVCQQRRDHQRPNNLPGGENENSGEDDQEN
jgi:hypothetical protein